MSGLVARFFFPAEVPLKLDVYAVAPKMPVSFSRVLLASPRSNDRASGPSSPPVRHTRPFAYVRISFSRGARLALGTAEFHGVIRRHRF